MPYKFLVPIGLSFPLHWNSLICPLSPCLLSTPSTHPCGQLHAAFNDSTHSWWGARTSGLHSPPTAIPSSLEPHLCLWALAPNLWAFDLFIFLLWPTGPHLLFPSQLKGSPDLYDTQFWLHLSALSILSGERKIAGPFASQSSIMTFQRERRLDSWNLMEISHQVTFCDNVKTSHQDRV